MDHRPHTLPAEKLLAHYAVSEEKGLSQEQYLEAKKKYGPNGACLTFRSFRPVVRDKLY